MGLPPKSIAIDNILIFTYVLPEKDAIWYLFGCLKIVCHLEGWNYRIIRYLGVPDLQTDPCRTHFSVDVPAKSGHLAGRGSWLAGPIKKNPKTPSVNQILRESPGVSGLLSGSQWLHWLSLSPIFLKGSDVCFGYDSELWWILGIPSFKMLIGWHP